ncbi:hypothetical protein [Salinisphaera hydrothermalis]|uniref:Glycosyl transferase family protein n=1 Tax=Salinisphaera hydrothermalis (strain C41B8) TaxID=1304275 RepID=A0A084IP47_SALHC|nr:hypothetical protein [Salinisphaera hydrothermalis]KEZ78481.1 glycosyl transferase family protein [Salinisphaera hydrothermalis C41B8]
MQDIQIYIGCSPAQTLVAKVLEWSVRKHASRAVQFYHLHAHAVDFRMPSKPQNRPGTPFSFQRFMIPEIAGFKGRGIYMDCDQIVFKDIARVFDHPLDKQPLAFCDTHKGRKARPMLRSSFMLLDCERMDWRMSQIVSDLDAERYSYQRLFSLEDYSPNLPRTWNSLDRYRWPFTGMLHYTGKSTQPWIHHRHKLSKLWFEYLFQAVDNGYITGDEVDQAVQAELVRPSLNYQLEKRLADARRLPDSVKKTDEAFIEACAQREYNNVPGEYRTAPESAERPA